VPSTWDAGVWDDAEWQAGPPPTQDWGKDWRWWYQVGHGGIIELNGLLVEARWSTDSHTLGDGTFRGDLQPGTCTIRFWDPGHALDRLDKLGCVFALYKPTGACWCWFYDSLARGLYAPGDPADADTVFTGSLWPLRATNQRGAETSFPVQSVAARLAAVANLMNSSAYLSYPPVAAAVAGQAQNVAATAQNTTTMTWPGLLDVVRDAAAPGVAWLAPAGAAAGAGSLTLSYARWETANARVLDRSQIIAGPPSTADGAYIVGWAGFAAVDGATGTQTQLTQGSGTANAWGYQGPTQMRMWGNVGTSGQGEWYGCSQTAGQLIADRGDATEQILSTVDVQSGGRRHPDGSPTNVDWDPYAHHFAPVDVVSIVDNAGATKRYRVARSDHRLTATVWQTTHTLDKYTAATPLP
jgi:hypothetical protein